MLYLDLAIYLHSLSAETKIIIFQLSFLTFEILYFFWLRKYFNEEEKRIVEEEVSGDNTQENVTNMEKNVDTQQEGETENTVEKVTEIMAVETQEDAKDTNNNE